MRPCGASFCIGGLYGYLGRYCCAGGAMAAFARLIVCLLFSVWSASVWSYGAVPMQNLVTFSCGYMSGGKVGYGRTGPAACMDFIFQNNPNGYWKPGIGAGESEWVTWTLGTCEPVRCFILSKSVPYKYGKPLSIPPSTGNWYELIRGGTAGMTCVQWSTKVSSSMCECNAGFKPSSGECVPYSCPVAGNYTSMTQPDQAVVNVGDSICMAGCSYTPSRYKVGQDGQIWAGWPFKSAAKTCGGDKGSDGGATGEQNTSKPAPVPCGDNQCPGTVSMNGVSTQMCVACKGTAAPPTTEAASAPAGGASGAGDTTKTTQTSCDGTTCTTTSTTKDSSGTVTGSTSKTEAQENFCEQNPQSQLCKKSTFGGSCASTTCDGDAVQCALAQEVIKRNCQWYDDANETKPQQDVGKAAIADGDQPDWHPAKHAEEKNLSGSVDSGDALGGGSCPSDQVVSGPFGSTLSVPFSRICEPASMLGNALVGLAMLVAAFIMFKG